MDSHKCLMLHIRITNQISNVSKSLSSTNFQGRRSVPEQASSLLFLTTFFFRLLPKNLVLKFTDL